MTEYLGPARPARTAAARRRERDRIADEAACPFWVDERGIRHLMLPTGVVYSATEAKLAELWLQLNETGQQDERQLAVLERMLTADEQAVIRDALEMAKDRGLFAEMASLVDVTPPKENP